MSMQIIAIKLDGNDDVARGSRLLLGAIGDMVNRPPLASAAALNGQERPEPRALPLPDPSRD